jgi:hypothetical protein
MERGNQLSCGTSGRIVDRRKILARHNFDLAGKDLKLNFEFSAICSTAESVEKILKAKRYLRQIYWLRPSVVRTQPHSPSTSTSKSTFQIDIDHECIGIAVDYGHVTSPLSCGMGRGICRGPGPCIQAVE